MGKQVKLTKDELINNDEFQEILDELLCDFSATKNIWFRKVKGCKSPIAKFIPNSLKQEFASKTADDITFEVAEYLFYNE